MKEIFVEIIEEIDELILNKRHCCTVERNEEGERRKEQVAIKCKVEWGRTKNTWMEAVRKDVHRKVVLVSPDINGIDPQSVFHLPLLYFPLPDRCCTAFHLFHLFPIKSLLLLPDNWPPRSHYYLLPECRSLSSTIPLKGLWGLLKT